MATTSMLTGNALTEKKWALQGWMNAGMKTVFGLAAKKGIIHYADDLVGTNARGDEITFNYINKLTGIPVGEGGTLDGNEEAQDLGNYKIAINVTRVGVSFPNNDTIEQQRTGINFGDKAAGLISNRHMEFLDTAFFYQAAGSNPTSFTLNSTTWSGTNKLFVLGHNTPVAPSANKIVRAGGAATDEALTSSDKMSISLIDLLLEKNANSNQPIEPASDGYFHLFLSPEQVVDLKQDTTGAIQWYQNQLAMLTSGGDNQLTGAIQRNGTLYLGEYSGVKIYQAGRVAFGQNSSTSAVITSVRRGVMLGKDALTFASSFAAKLTDSDVPLRFKAQMKDYDYYKGIEGRFIWGLKKTVASNSEDVGVMVLSTYAAAHA